MQTECTSGAMEFEGCERRRVVAAFDGGELTSDAGALLLRQADRVLDLSSRVADCFSDRRNQDLWSIAFRPWWASGLQGSRWAMRI